MNNPRTHLAVLAALGTALAMPLALAQSAVTPEVRDAQDVATETAAAAQDAQDATQAPPATEPQPAARQLSWADVDADGNGTISRVESASLPALEAVFDEADADGDGELTADEYRNHAVKTGGEG